MDYTVTPEREYLSDTAHLIISDPEQFATPKQRTQRYGIPPQIPYFGTPQWDAKSRVADSHFSTYPQVPPPQISPKDSFLVEKCRQPEMVMNYQYSPPITPIEQLISEELGTPPTTSAPFGLYGNQNPLFSTSSQTSLCVGGVEVTLEAYHNGLARPLNNGKAIIDCRLELKVPNFIFDGRLDRVSGIEVRFSSVAAVCDELVNATLVGNNVILWQDDIVLRTISMIHDVSTLTHDELSKTISFHFSDGLTPQFDLTLLHREDMFSWLQCLFNPFVYIDTGKGSLSASSAGTSQHLLSPFAVSYIPRKQLNLVLILPHPELLGVPTGALEGIVRSALGNMGTFDRLAVSFYGFAEEITTGFHRYGSEIWKKGAWLKNLLYDAKDRNILPSKQTGVWNASQMVSGDKLASNIEDSVYTIALVSTGSDTTTSESIQMPSKIIGSFYSIAINGTGTGSIEHLAMRSNGGFTNSKTFDEAGEVLAGIVKSERCCVDINMGIGIKLNGNATIRSLSLRRGHYDEFDVDQVKQPMGSRALCPIGHIRESETYCLDLQVEADASTIDVTVSPFEAFLRSGWSPGRENQSAPVQIQTFLEATPFI